MGIPEGKEGPLLAYCRIDEPDAGELALLDVLYDSAVDYMTNAGVEAPAAGTPRAARYDLLVSSLVRRERLSRAEIDALYALLEEQKEG